MTTQEGAARSRKQPQRSAERSLNRCVSRAIILEMMRIGHVLDINRGGCINIWTTIDDKPACWDMPITQGSLDCAAEFCGTLAWEWDEKGEIASFRVEACPYSLLDGRDEDGIRLHHYFGECRTLGAETWEALLDWLEVKANNLIDLANAYPGYPGREDF